MRKTLKVKNINIGMKTCKTVRELAAWLAERSRDGVLDNKNPIVLRCGGKNFQLSGFKEVDDVPVLIGKRRPTIG